MLPCKVTVPTAINDDKPPDEYIKDYIQQEFPGLSGQSSCSYFLPQSYTLSGDPDRAQSDEAENCVFQRLKSFTASRDDSKFIIFHSLEYGGIIKNKEKHDWREHDFVIFVQKEDSKKIVYCEVKSNPDASKSKRVKVAKQKAEFQLNDHLIHLQNGLGISEEDINSIQKIVFWPNLSKEKCGSFNDQKSHHVGRETLRDQEQFNQMMVSLVMESDSGVGKDLFETLMCKFINLSCGTFMKTVEKNQDEQFFLFSQQQLKILREEPCHVLPFPLPMHDLTDIDKSSTLEEIGEMYDTFFKTANGKTSEREEKTFELWKNIFENRKKRNMVRYFTNVFPKEFLAPAGAGKTLLIQKILLDLHKTGKLSEKNQALYVSGVSNVKSDVYRKETPNMVQMSKFLESNGIKNCVKLETFKQFRNFQEIKSFASSEKFRHIKHIFVDEGECLPAEMLEVLCHVFLENNSCSSQSHMKTLFYETQSSDLAQQICNYRQKKATPSNEHKGNIGYFWIMTDYLQNYHSLYPFPIKCKTV